MNTHLSTNIYKYFPCFLTKLSDFCVIRSDINFESCPHTSMQLILDTSIFKNAATPVRQILLKELNFWKSKKRGPGVSI